MRPLRQALLVLVGALVLAPIAWMLAVMWAAATPVDETQMEQLMLFAYTLVGAVGLICIAFLLVRFFRFRERHRQRVMGR